MKEAIMSSDTFELQLSQPPTTIVPIEPLHSMFHCAPIEAVEYLYNDLSIIDTMCLCFDEKAISGNP